MSKKVFIINGKRVEMGYEDLLEQFSDMLYNRSYKFLDNHRGFPLLEMEDILQTARISLWEAMQTYDIDKNTHFSTHLHYQILNDFKTLSCKASAKFRQNEVNEISSDNIDVEFIEDMSCGDEMVWTDVELQDWINNLNLTQTEEEAIEHMISGRTLVESAEKYNLSHADVMRARVRRLRAKLKKIIGTKGGLC